MDSKLIPFSESVKYLGMIDLTPKELMIQKVGISAYFRLKQQLTTPFAAKDKNHTPPANLGKSME